MQGRVEQLLDLPLKENLLLGTELTHGLVRCLTAREATSALEPSLYAGPVLRRALLRKITSDIEEGGFKNIHSLLLSRLFECYFEVPSQKRSSCAHCLNYLFDVSPPDRRKDILLFFITSPHIATRRRAYKILRKNWEDSYAIDVAEAWRAFQDKECAFLIAAHFPIQDVILMRAKLTPQLEDWQLAKLYRRLCSEDKKYLDELSEIDEVSYVYLCAKLGIKINEQKAMRIFERNALDGRRGLLIWSFGVLGFWAFLVQLSESGEDILMRARKRQSNS